MYLRCSLEEEGVITECLIKVLDDAETIDFDFQTENVVTKVVFKVRSAQDCSHRCLSLSVG